MRIHLRRLAVVVAALAVGASIAPVVFADSAPVTGLKGQYFDNEDFSGTVVERVDPTVDFTWEGTAPVAGIASHTFAVRWTGTITPRYSEHYTFSTRSDDGIRVVIGGQTVIDNWTIHAVRTDTGTIDLVADEPYEITVEFYEHLGRGEASLSWQSPSQAAEIVPEERLAPPAAPTDTDTDTTPTTTTGTTPTTTSTPTVSTPTVSTPAAKLPELPAPASAPDPPAAGLPEASFPPPSTPIAGETFNAEPIRGEVLVRTNEGVRRLGRGHTLPMGARLDTRRGAVKIQTAKARNVNHHKQYARISGGTFEVGQSARGDRVVTLDLTHGDFEDCAPQSAVSPLGKRGAHSAARKTGSDKVRSLWGHGKGRFRTVGRNAAATVRGTFWNVEDTCDATIVRVREGIVDVEDLHSGKTLTLLAGDSYTAWLHTGR